MAPVDGKKEVARFEHPIFESEYAITWRSHELFMEYANDAGNWSGTPLVGGNVGGSKEDRGNLTQLKRAGLITTIKDNEDGKPLTWISFTAAGVDYAKKHGVDLSWTAQTAI